MLPCKQAKISGLTWQILYLLNISINADNGKDFWFWNPRIIDQSHLSEFWLHAGKQFVWRAKDAEYIGCIQKRKTKQNIRLHIKTTFLFFHDLSCKSYITAKRIFLFSTLVVEKGDYCTSIMHIPLWATSSVSLVMNVVPGDDIVEARGNRLSHSKDEFPVKGFPQQLQDFLTLLARWQEGSTKGAAVPHPRVWVLRL